MSIPSNSASRLRTIAQAIEDCLLPGHKAGYIATYIDVRSIYIRNVLKEHIAAIAAYDIVEDANNRAEGTKQGPNAGVNSKVDGNPLIIAMDVVTKVFSLEFVSCNSILPQRYTDDVMGKLLEGTLRYLLDRVDMILERAKRASGSPVAGYIIYMLLRLSVHLKDSAKAAENDLNEMRALNKDEASRKELQNLSERTAERLFVDTLAMIPRLIDRAAGQMMIAYIDDISALGSKLHRESALSDNLKIRASAIMPISTVKSPTGQIGSKLPLQSSTSLTDLTRGVSVYQYSSSTDLATRYEAPGLQVMGTHIHEVVSSALSFLRGLVVYEKNIVGFNFVLSAESDAKIILRVVSTDRDQDLEGKAKSSSTINTVSNEHQSNDHSSESKPDTYCTSFYIFGRNLFNALDKFLLEFAEILNKKAPADIIFLMNNYYYISVFLRDVQELSRYFKADAEEFEEMLKNQVDLYIDVWRSIIDPLVKATDHQSESTLTSANLLSKGSDKSPRKINQVRDILKLFYDNIEHNTTLGIQCTIANASLRNKIILDVLDIVLTPYQNFLESYADVLKSNLKLVKLEPIQLRHMIQSMFKQ
jgi:hypothetical protein